MTFFKDIFLTKFRTHVVDTAIWTPLTQLRHPQDMTIALSELNSRLENARSFFYIYIKCSYTHTHTHSTSTVGMYLYLVPLACNKSSVTKSRGPSGMKPRVTMGVIREIFNPA